MWWNSSGDEERFNPKKDKAFAGTDFLYGDEGGDHIVIPRTEAASIYWGKGTHWDTAARSEGNTFNDYAVRGDLFIVVLADGRKFQFQPANSGLTTDCMDGKGNRISAEDLLAVAPFIRKSQTALAGLWALDPKALSPIVGADMTETFYRIAVEQWGEVLGDVPEARRSDAMCLAAVSQNAEALRHVPEERRSDAICLAAVSQSGLTLERVPEARRSDAICLAAVSQNGKALRHVPEARRSDAICLAAVSENGRAALEHVPEARRSEEVVFAAISDMAFARELRREVVPRETVARWGLRRMEEELAPLSSGKDEARSVRMAARALEMVVREHFPKEDEERKALLSKGGMNSAELGKVRKAVVRAIGSFPKGAPIRTVGFELSFALSDLEADAAAREKQARSAKAWKPLGG